VRGNGSTLGRPDRRCFVQRLEGFLSFILAINSDKAKTGEHKSQPDAATADDLSIR
jgi:hypothetical protein